MIITHYREKLINAIIYFAKHTKHCGKTKLLKLLYFLDFYHFKQTGKSVTGLEYFAWEKGPVPKDLFEELPDNMKSDLKDSINIVLSESLQKIVPRKKFNDEYFTNREKELLETISFIFGDTKADDMVEVTHLKNEPWHRTLKEKGPWQKIDYLLSIDDAEDSLTYNEAKERMEEISEMHQIFGTI
jgi:uncharacterized phage-associated protein